MGTFRHRPTRVQAERWTGDLDTMQRFLAELERDGIVDGAEVSTDGNVLWVTHRAFGRTEVFPVAMLQWVVCSAGGALRGMSAAAFARLYEEAPQLATVAV